MRIIPLATATLCLLVGTASADEVWSTKAGEVIYETEEGDTAILSYPVGGDARGYLYFPGLAGNFDARGVHTGYWIAESNGTCATTMAGPNEIASNSWGRATIIFHEPGFPSGWTLLTGNCFDDPASAVIGEPVTGDE